MVPRLTSPPDKAGPGKPAGSRRGTTAGDFSVVYEEHVWQVYGFYAYRLRTRADAEDLTQQTFERALRAWKRFDPARGSALTWLMAIARNLLIDHVRADRSARQRPLHEVREAADPALVLADTPDLGLAPDLEQALRVLDGRDRELLALRYGGDLTGREIAELTGLTLANVQQILSRALRRLRAALEAAPPQAASGPEPAAPRAPSTSSSVPEPAKPAISAPRRRGR